MSSDLVFMTGATGFVGHATLVAILEAGYSVRAAIRAGSRQDAVLAAPSIKALNPGSRLTFVVIPDFSVPGAYTEALKGATLIVHVASPTPANRSPDFQSAIVEPAVAGTVGILEAALKSPSVRRVVITSSIYAMIPAKALTEETPYGTVFDHTSRASVAPGPFDSVMEAYGASKVAALAASDRFMAEQNPHFDLINIGPTFIVGRNELVTDANHVISGSNRTLAALIIKGGKMDNVVVGATVHVDDVARMHVKALDSKVPAGTYIGNSEGYAGIVWNNVPRIVAENYPKAAEKGILKIDGELTTSRLRIDASQTEEIMGFRFLNLEEQVKSVASQYLELLGERAE